MSNTWTDRTELLIGKERLAYLKTRHVLIVGVGGVGAYAAEMLCRAGIGKLTIVDGDVVQSSNINRQLIALNSTIDKPKVEILKHRLLDINPELTINTYFEYLRDERTAEVLQAGSYDYVIDAIDTLSPKVYLIYYALQHNLKLISSMGSGGKKDPSAIRIANLSNTYNCTLARFVKKRLRKLHASLDFPVVFSTEQVDKEAVALIEEKNKKSMVGTISYMPALFGCHLAAYVIENI